MFNTSKNTSSERSSRARDAHTAQRGPSTQRSRSRSALSSPTRHSESRPQWKVPVWVHCEKCFVTHDINQNLSLLSCGHIFCGKCLHLDDATSHDSSRIPCVRCNKAETHISVSGSLDEKLHGMFHQGWMDPVLQIDVRQIQFMMTKTQNYSKFLSKSVKQSVDVPPEWKERQNRLKQTYERVQKLKKMEQQITQKAEALKSEAMKVHKNVTMFRAMYEQAKVEYRRKQQLRQSQQSRGQAGQGNYRKDMKLVSSGRNEQSNQYIGQVRSSSHRPPVNQNQSAPDIRNYSQRVVPPSRQNQSLNMPRADPSSRHTPDSASNRSSMPSATFRPQPNNVNADNHRYDPQRQQAPKRLVPSYAYDKYSNPPKRAAHYVEPVDLNTSISSVGSSMILNPPPAGNFYGRPTNSFRPYK